MIVPPFIVLIVPPSLALVLVLVLILIVVTPHTDPVVGSG